MEFLYLYPPLAVAQAAFTVWMLIDAHHRRVESFWFWVILFVPVIGAWAYFFAVKGPDLQRAGGSSWAGSLFQRRASLEELRYRAEQVPTLANHLDLAERLIEREAYDEALPHLEAAWKMEPDHCQVLYGLAVCHCRQGRPEQALPLLETVIRRHPSWSDCAAWLLLIAARLESGDRPGALETCRDLVRQTPTLKHRCLLAEHLLDSGLADEASRLLEQALREHAFAPGPIRRRNRRWASVARQLQKRVPAR